MLLLIVALIVLAIIFVTFSSKVSAIPFFPSNPKDMSQIIEGLDLKNDQVVLDLGAGTGTVIFAAAREAHKKGLTTKFIAIDINFILVGIMWFHNLFHPNRKNIQVVMADLFKYDYEKATKGFKNVTYFMYVSPWFTDPMADLVKNIGRNIHFVTYFYSIKNLKEKKRLEGLHSTFIYEV
ncbi:hypothetical protein BH09PAT2_BH09PAT2_02730 [soil metagenome]